MPKRNRERQSRLSLTLVLDCGDLWRLAVNSASSQAHHSIGMCWKEQNPPEGGFQNVPRQLSGSGGHSCSILPTRLYCLLILSPFFLEETCDGREGS